MRDSLTPYVPLSGARKILDYLRSTCMSLEDSSDPMPHEPHSHYYY
jgi:hypothetical protein